MLIKILLWLIIIYLGFRMLKSWVLSRLTLQSGNRDTSAEIEDVMVKDPVCGVYVPRREALQIRDQGQDVYFCSEKCRDAYFK